MLITQYVPKHKLGKLETSHCVEKTLPGLLSRTGDSSSRLRIMAVKFIQVRAFLCTAVWLTSRTSQRDQWVTSDLAGCQCRACSSEGRQSRSSSWASGCDWSMACNSQLNNSIQKCLVRRQSPLHVKCWQSTVGKICWGITVLFSSRVQ